MTDTGSMEPIPDAAAWAQRADAWSQRPSSALAPLADDTTSRWSEVATTGRPAFPPEGVGWRTASSEWRSAAESRWRQTTEWRSSTGTSGWRSTTEAWQADGSSDLVRPPVEPLTRMPAISGTAWPTPQADDQPWATTSAGTEPRPPWQPSPEAAAAAGDVSPPWQAPMPAKPAASWQASPAEPAASWQASPAEPAASWQASPAEPAASWQIAAESTPSWQAPAEPTPSWQATAEPATSWSTKDGSTKDGLPGEGSASGGTPSWQTRAEPATPSWQTPATPAPSWQTRAEPGESWQTRAEPPDTWQTGGGPTETWQTRSDPDGSWQTRTEVSGSWQTRAAPGSGRPGPADGTPSWQARAEPTTPSWQTTAEPAQAWQSSAAPTSAVQSPPSWQAQPTDPPSWQTRPEPSWQSGPPPSASRDSGSSRSDGRPSWQAAAPTSGRAATDRSNPATPTSGTYTGSWSVPATYDDGRHLVREDDRAQWRRDSAAGRNGADDQTRRIGRRRAPEAEPPGRGGGTGWAVKSDADNWAGHTDTGVIPAFRDDEPGWQRAAGDRDAGGDRGTGRGRPGPADRWRTESDDRWSRDDDSRDGGRRRDGGDPRDAGTARRRLSSTPSDPWARDAADTGVGSLAWQSPGDTGTGTWRPSSDTATWRRYVDDPEDDIDRDRPRSGAAGTWQAERRPGRAADDDDVRRWADPDDRPRRRGAVDDEPTRRRGEPDDRIRRRPGSDAPGTWRQPATDPAQPDDGLAPGSGLRPPTTPDDDRTQAWRRELQADMRGEAPGPAGDRGGTDVTQIRPQPEPGSWRSDGRGGSSGGGSASYRESSTDDWRQQLSAPGGGPGSPGRGGGRGSGAAGFPRFQPSGAVAPAPAPPENGGGAARAAVAMPDADASRDRTELLVGSRSGAGAAGASWQDPPDTQWPPRRPTETGSLSRSSTALAGPYERRPVTALPETSGRQRSLLEPDEDLESDPGGPLAAVGFTAAWYAVPVVLFLGYMLVLDGAQQSQALRTLASAAPQFGLSLVLSLAVAVGLRWVSGTWKAASVGLAAAVLGGGLTTVLNSAITGQSLS